MGAFLLDVRYGFRTLRRNLAFTVGAIAVLALGVGANTSIFGVARVLVFQKLPFQEPQRLVAVWKERIQTGVRQGASWPDLTDWEAQKHVFAGVAAYMDSTEYASADSTNGTAEPISDIHVTEGFFRLLGVNPAIGRLFAPGEFGEQHAIASQEPVIVSHAFWQRRMGGRTDVLGRFVTVGAVRHFVIGVLPPEFRMLRTSTPEVFSPLRAFPGHSVERRMAYLNVLARLKAGVTIPRARAEMSAYSRRAASEYRATDAGLRCNLESLHDHWFSAMRPLMFLLLGTVAVVLCIACADVAFLFLVRATRREPEIALRMAMGAGKARICRQLMTEALLLAAAGGIAGYITAMWTEGLFTAFSSAADMRLPQIEFDGVVVAFAVLISLATTVSFGLVPAWRVANLRLQDHLKRGGASASHGIATRFGRAAMVAEIALSTLLLSGAVTLLKAFHAATSAHPGFQAGHTLTVSIGQVPLREGFQQREDYFWSQLLERTNSLPGVRAAAICRAFPLSEDAPPAKVITKITPEDRRSQDSEGLAAEFQDVSPGYFRALGISLLRGRTFDSRDASWGDAS
jgi:predicted permease